MAILLNDKDDVRVLAGGWMLLALVAFALSTACAVLLVIARIPLPGAFAASASWFRSALVLHVSLAVIVWFLCCAAGLWTLAAGGRATWLRWTALAMAAVGMAAMASAIFSSTAIPLLANYIPVLDSPVFLAGLGLFFLGMSLCGMTSCGALIRQLRRDEVEVWKIGAALSISAAAIAVAGMISTMAMTGIPSDLREFEIFAWGPGHVLQVVHVLLLMSVWTILGEQALGGSFVPRRWLIALFVLAALPLLATPVIYQRYPEHSADFRHAFTALMSWGSWPAAVVLGGHVLWRLFRAGRIVCVAQLPLAISVLLFLLGCAFGAAIRGESTMVPAHYHGTVGAVTLAYMALGYRLLPEFGFGRQNGRLTRWQPVLYGVGLLVLACALAWSGWLGVPRKTLHVDVIVQYPAYFVAIGLIGVGGFLSIVGAGWFVSNIVRAVQGGLRIGSLGAAWRVAQVPILASVVSFFVLSGLTFDYWPNPTANAADNPVGAQLDAPAHAAQKRKEEIDRRFSQSVTLLSSKQYEAAATELHRLLELAPKMPEAHVNMGFAMIGMHRYAVARDFFNVAIELNRDQRNAYFGLAIALEGAGDLRGALGAMRSYVHLEKSNDAFLRKANAAIWEWEAALQMLDRKTPAGRRAGEIPKNEKKIENSLDHGNRE